MVMPNQIRPSLAPYQEYPLHQLLHRTATIFPQKIAVIDGERRFTYQQLNEYSDRFAAGLASLGVAKGDRVGVLAPNCVEFVIAFFGVIKAGAVASTINTGYREHEIAHQVNDSGTETLVVHPDVLQTVQLALDEARDIQRLIVINETSKDPASFWGLIESSPSTPPPIVIDARNDLAALPYSSGTTGLAKGVMLTHFNLTANLKQFIDRPDEDSSPLEDDVVLAHLPFFHIYGLQVVMNATIAIGGTQVIMGRFDMELLLRLLSDHGVTQLFTVPPVGLGLTKYPGVSNYNLSSLRMAVLAAAPSSREFQSSLQEALGIPVIQGYGMTELSPVTNIDLAEPDRIRHGSVGPALADTEEKVVDPEQGTTELAPGEQGELLIRGPQVMKGYFNNAQATADTISEHGWLSTGDIVRMDPDGYVWILDRKKELIKYKGFQVPPAELEGLLLQHPDVVDVGVIGKPDEESGEIPKAFVVRRQGAEVSAEELMGFAAGKIATFKQIREVEFVDAIPKNASGKILRRVLMEQERAKAYS
jgi:acyl-CoA synthetase (AMP-forming)/AMP-acid ligase II